MESQELQDSLSSKDQALEQFVLAKERLQAKLWHSILVTNIIIGAIAGSAVSSLSMIARPSVLAFGICVVVTIGIILLVMNVLSYNKKIQLIEDMLSAQTKYFNTK